MPWCADGGGPASSLGWCVPGDTNSGWGQSQQASGIATAGAWILASRKPYPDLWKCMVFLQVSIVCGGPKYFLLKRHVSTCGRVGESSMLHQSAVVKKD